jgi:hypothetical protein
MRKILFISVFLISLIGFAQGGPKVDVIKYRDAVTTAIRDTFDVPAGEIWLIWNETTTQLEIAQEDDVWSAVGGGGASQLSGLSDVNTSTPTNRNVLIADGIDFESRALLEADISDLGSYLPLAGGTLTGLVSQQIGGGSPYSTYFGSFAGLVDDNTNNGNSGFGHGALGATTTGINNSAFGGQSLATNIIGNNTTAVGYGALEASTGDTNTAVGAFALGDNTIGEDNIGLGYLAGWKNTTASGNVNIGHSALQNQIGGGNNIAIGTDAGAKITGGVTDLTNSTSSIFIGANTRAGADAQTNEIVIGTTTTGNGNNTVTIGNSSITDTYLEGTIHGDGSGLTGVATTPEDVAYGAGWDGDLDATSKNTIYDEMETRVDSDTTGTNAASARTIDNLISLNKSDYLALTPDAATFYVITDATSPGTATGDGTTTVDWGEGNYFHFQFGAFNETFTFTAPANEGTYLMRLIQDSTGSRTATWPGTVKWPGGTAPTLTTTATTGTDVITFYYDGTNYLAVSTLDFQ